MHCRSCKFDFCWQVSLFAHDSSRFLLSYTSIILQCHPLVTNDVITHLQCMSPWNGHSCNRFKEEDSADAMAAANSVRISLERYLFYFNRFANHDHSSKLEDKLWAMVGAKQKELQKKNFSWIDVQVCSCLDRRR